MAVFAYIKNNKRGYLSADSETELRTYIYGIGLGPSLVKNENEWNVHIELNTELVGHVRKDPAVQLLINPHFVKRLQRGT